MSAEVPATVTPTCFEPCIEERHLVGRAACKKSKGHDGDHACSGDWLTHTWPAEGPATVTPHTDSCRGPRGRNACDCGAEQRAVGPATVTLTDAELEPLRVALMVAYASQPMGYDRAKRATDRTVAEVVAPFAARVDALTADLAVARVALDAMMERDTAASVRYDALATDHRRWVDKAFEAERVIANVRAELNYADDHGIRDQDDEALVSVPVIRRALLPAAPTETSGVGDSLASDVASDRHPHPGALPAAPTGEDTNG